MLVTNFLDLLKKHQDEQKASKMASYMKHRFAFLGIDASKRKELQKELISTVDTSSELAQVACELWQQEPRECQYVAIDLLRAKHRLWQKDFLPFFESITLDKSWWDSVDMIASNLVGKFLLHFGEYTPKMDEWIVSEHMWLRRSALIYQLKYKEKTDHHKLFEYIRKTKEEKEFFIRKAIGWALRELSKSKKEKVFAFLQEVDLSPLSRKEASKYLN